MKSVRVVLIDEAGAKYQSLQERASLSKKELAIVESIRNKAEIIKKDVHYGVPVNKKLIPALYRSNYDIKNLFRVELPYFWRMLYTLKNDPGDSNSILAVILDIVDHNEYDRLFGYKGK
ncbi:hypothetical protein [uncultured Methanolobus sp.]|uniref:hypothetical protein n=1 Tax=uncultured Methanolobus sp. TaxID=218300 RepID=UPI002AAB9F8F|nr:hypothetical protein [uncultured Methanolobus sp.]